jgi:CheY-like chemotaxis protein
VSAADGARRPARVLVVDDDDDNGREALDRLRATVAGTDLILLDLLMPVMDGEQFRQEQLGDPRLAAIPTVVISANSQVRETAARMRATAWLRKPVDLMALLDAVAAHVAPR